MKRLRYDPTESIGGCGCGGAIHIQRRDTSRREFRYEVYCLRCMQCDPNGYATLLECHSQGVAYFKGITK